MRFTSCLSDEMSFRVQGKTRFETCDGTERVGSLIMTQVEITGPESLDPLLRLSIGLTAPKKKFCSWVRLHGRSLG